MKVDATSITNANARVLLQQGLAAIGAGDAAIDMSAVVACDSSAVALVLAWQRAARDSGVKLALTGVPKDLLSLAALYGVEVLLGAPPLQ
ncbi:MAG TPA: STAS domain-containing protein [Burkholderiaceae bacterium]